MTIAQSIARPIVSAGASPVTGGGASGGARLTKWIAAKALVASGTRNALVVCMGDSTTRGATPGPIQASVAYPGLLAGLLPSGSRSSVAGWTTLDSGLSVGAGWAAANTTIGGVNWETNTAVAPISYTPSNAVNTFEVWYIDFAGAGSFTLDIDGAGTQTVNALGSSGFRKATITTGGAAGTKTLNILRVSGYASIAFIRAFNSASKEISVVNSGVSGSVVASWSATANPWNPPRALTSLAPDLTIICLTINDWKNGTSLATFKTNTQIIIDAAKVTGSVLLVTGVPSSPANTSIVTQQTYIDVYYQLLAENAGDCDLLDMTATWGSYDAANANGWMSDDLHPNLTGYVQFAARVREKL